MSNMPSPDNRPDVPTYEGRALPRSDDEIVDQGAGFDARTLITRRRVLGAVGVGAGTLALAACTGSSSDASSTSSNSSSVATSVAAGEIPQETNGPYPADGTNGVNVLEESGIVRSDITSSLDGGTNVDGVPLSFTFTVTDTANAGAPFDGVAVYIWQCDAHGLYSMYSDGVEDETYLRGVQIAGADGHVTFSTIVPACYKGRWTHIHFEIYPNADAATDVDNAIATSQVAFPQDMLDDVYQLDTYSGSAENLAEMGSLYNDNVFSDGYDLEMGTFTGDTTTGYFGSLPVSVDTTTEPTMSAAPPNGGGQNGGGPGGGTPPSGDTPR